MGFLEGVKQIGGAALKGAASGGGIVGSAARGVQTGIQGTGNVIKGVKKWNAPKTRRSHFRKVK